MTIFQYFKKRFGLFARTTKKFAVMNKQNFEKKISTDSSQLAPKKLPPNIAMPQLSSNVEFEVLPTPVKSASDKKEYRVIRLKNGLTACLVSDTSPLPDEEEENDEEECEETTDDDSDDESDESDTSDSEATDDDYMPEQKMAAASLSVGVGSFSDPEAVPGMAHFLEHMVFMGSEKFPEENDFDSFISKRGGSDNASTDCEVTTFYFECLEKDLYAGLDKFSQFFVSPLMKRSSITREREAIESEFQMALPSDPFRKEQLLVTLAKEESPVNMFTWGNLITLRDNVSEDDLYEGVHKFRKRHYSAHRMTLAIQARLPLDLLQNYVLECFNSVPSNDLPPDDFSRFTDVFDTARFPKIYHVQPVKAVTQVDLTWVLPSLLHKYKSKPHQYVSSILGDEGKGSLLSYLRKKVWVLTLTAGNSESGGEHNSLYCLFQINMTVTDEGLSHLNEVIEIVYSYINMMRKLGPQERLYNEMKTISDTLFKFATERRAIEFVEELSEAMQMYPPEDYIAGAEIYYEYDPDAIQTVLSHLVPKKMNIMVLQSGLNEQSYDKVEKWFGTKYAEKDPPKKWLKKWENAKPLDVFTLPLPNQFLTEDFTILDEDTDHPEYPEKVLQSDLVELWFRKDQKFKLPDAYFYFYLVSPKAVETPRAVAILDFYITLLHMRLAEDIYPAHKAQLGFKFKNNVKGLVLTVWGYNEKLHLLIDLITKHLHDFKSDLSQDIFNAVKDKLIKHYYNSALSPTSVAKDVRLSVLVDKHHALLDKYNAMPDITLEDIAKFSDEFIGSLYIKSLVQGNVTKEYAINIVNNIVSTLGCLPIDATSYPKFRVSKMPQGESVCMVESFNLNDSNSVITNYYQCGPFTIRDSAITEILMLIIQEPLFDILRTKEQLGYDVSCSDRDTYGVLGFTITVNAQATKNTTEFVESRIEEFVKRASQLLKDMSSEAFETTKKDLLKTKQCVDVSLKEESNRNWQEIAEDDYMFDRLKQEIGEIGKLTIGDVQEWWKRHTASGDENNFKKLSIQVVGFENAGDKQTETTKQGDQFTKLELKFLTGESAKQTFIKDIAGFKQNLLLYPVIGTYNIRQ